MARLQAVTPPHLHLQAAKFVASLLLATSVAVFLLIFVGPFKPLATTFSGRALHGVGFEDHANVAGPVVQQQQQQQQGRDGGGQAHVQQRIAELMQQLDERQKEIDELTEQRQQQGKLGEQQQAQAANDKGQAGYGGALPMTPPTRYQLPPECEKHTVLYGGIYSDLAAWMTLKPQGIEERDLATACGNLLYGNGTDDPRGAGNIHRFLLHGSRLYTVDPPWIGPAPRKHTEKLPISGQHFWQTMGIVEVANKWGLPDMEFVMPWRDNGIVDGPMEDGSLCPAFSTAKQRTQFDLLIPEGQWIEYQIDKWVREDDPIPWEEKIDKAIARYTGFCPYWSSLPLEKRRDRFGREITCPRNHYIDLAATSNDTLDVRCANCPNSTGFDYIKLSDQRRWKYALDTDGWGPALRFYKLLGGGWTILKDYSMEHLWFFPALQPWVHYIPLRWSAPDEINHVIRWLRQNDGVARTIGRNAKHFARSHLTDEGRQCYIKVLFEEMAGLYTFHKKPSNYGRAVLVEDELADFLEPSKTNV